MIASTQHGRGSPHRRRILAAASVLAVLGVAGGAWFGRRDEPVRVKKSDRVPSDAGDDRPGGTTRLPGLGDADVLMVADGGASCVVGLRYGPSDSAASGMGPLLPGPAGPARFGPVGSAETGTSAGVWHVVTEEQQAEIHVPGVVVTDLLGERTEAVRLDGRAAEATVWFGPAWVQVRHFSGRQHPEACSDDQSFTVTVGGPDEQANRDLAVRIASSLVIAPSPVVSSRTGSHPAGSGPTSPGEPVDRAAVAGTWVLEAVSVGGAPVAVVDATNGGTDGRPGPPILNLIDPDRPALRGCNMVGLALDLHGSEGRLRLPSRALTTQAGCSGAQGEQESRILEVLSLGDPLVLRSDDRGRTLTIRDEETVLVFRQR